jgi:guanine nucleotide-binding protein subunit alpha-12
MSRRNVRKSCCCSGDLVTHLLRLRFTPEELEQRDKSRKIDKFLEKDKNSFRRQVGKR